MSGFLVDGSVNGHGQRVGSPISVAIIESHDLLRDSLFALLSADPRFIATGAWGEPQEAIAEMGAAPPDVVLLGLKLAERAGFEALKLLLASFGQTRVIATVDCQEMSCMVLHPQLTSSSWRTVRMVSQAFAEPDDCLQSALKAGAHGVIRLRCSYEKVAEAIRRAHSGRVCMEPATATRLAQQFLHAIHAGPVASENGSGTLTLRERQVVTLVAQGRSNKEIAGELQVSYSTVKNHVSSVLDKLALTDRTQLAVYAMDHALPGGNDRSEGARGGCPAALAASIAATNAGFEHVGDRAQA